MADTNLKTTSRTVTDTIYGARDEAAVVMY